MLWTDWVKGMLEKIPPQFMEGSSHKPPAEDEQVLGRLDEGVVRYFALADQLRHQTTQLLHEHEGVHLANPTKLDRDSQCLMCEETSNRLDELTMQIKVVREIGWMSARHQFSKYSGDIGIRENWQLVAIRYRIPEIVSLLIGKP